MAKWNLKTLEEFERLFRELFDNLDWMSWIRRHKEKAMDEHLTLGYTKRPWKTKFNVPQLTYRDVDLEGRSYHNFSMWYILKEPLMHLSLIYYPGVLNHPALSWKLLTNWFPAFFNQILILIFLSKCGINMKILKVKSKKNWILLLIWFGSSLNIN